MLEERVFTGGMDSDSDDRYIQQGDYRTAYCIRNSKKSDDSAFTVTNPKGTVLVEFALPSGNNKVIGSLNKQDTSEIFYFVYNSLEYHSILRYSGVTNLVTEVLRDPVLAFTENDKVRNPEIIDGILYFTHNNHPRKINIDRFIAGNYPSTLTEAHINNIVPQHNEAPTTAYLTDGTVNFNKLRKKRWQFRVQNIDWDNNKSAWGTASKFPTDEEEIIRAVNKNHYQTIANNAIDVTFNTGDQNIRKINLAVRDSDTSDWYLVDQIDKDELSISDNTTYTFRFFNDRTHLPIDITESSQLQDFVPLKAKDQTLLGDSRRILYANINEGFDQVPISVTSSVEIDERPLSSGSNTYAIQPVDEQDTVSDSVSSIEVQYKTDHLFQPDTAQPGNVISLTVRQSFTLQNSFGNTYTHNVVETFGYTVPSTASASGFTSDAMEYFITQIQASTTLNQTLSNGLIISADGYTWLNPPSATPTANNTIYLTTNIKGVSTATAGKFQVGDIQSGTFRTSFYVSAFSIDVTKCFKRGSKHPLGLVYYDYAGRRSTVMENDNMNVYVPFPTENGKFGPASIKLNINHQPPSWATHYQVVYAGSDFSETFIQFPIKSTPVPSTGVDNNGNVKVVIDLAAYSTSYNGQSTLVYSFTPGDRMRIIKRQNSTSNALFSQYYEYEVVGFDSGTQTLTYKSVTPSGDINLQIGDLIEIYTPRPTYDERLYYEIGEVFEIENPGLSTRQHKGSTQDQTSSQPAIVTLSDGDCYWRPRNVGFNIFTSNVDATYYIEDFSWSDFYESKIWDRAKPNKVDKNAKNIDRPSTCYFSNQYVPETFINGLSTFYDVAFKYYDINNGSIQAVDVYNDRLLIFQELKIGFSLINKSTIYNADGTANGTIAQLNQVLSDMNYYNKDYGVAKNPESIASYNGTYYFTDANRGAVCKLGGSGIFRISSSEDAEMDRVRMNKYFTNKFKELINSGKQFFVYGEYHKDLEEYVLSFEEVKELDGITYGKDEAPIIIPGDVLVQPETIAWSEDKGRWVTYYPFHPDYMSKLGTSLVSFKDGALYKHNSGDVSSFYGTTYKPSITAVFNAEPGKNKFFRHIQTKSTSAWACPEISNSYNQESELDATDFENFESVYKAHFLMDKTTPNVVNPLIEGDNLRCHSLVVKLENDSTTDEKLFSVGVGFSMSELND